MKYLAEYILFSLILCIRVFGQIDTTISSSDIIQNLLEESSLDAEDSQLIDLLEDLIENPININAASADELSKIPFIDLQTAREIVNYREKYGPFKFRNSIYNVPEIDNSELEKLLPFIRFGESNPFNSYSEFFQNISLHFRSRLIQDVQKRQGFITGKYFGSKPKIYNRLKLNLQNKIRLGVLTEKDAGEQSLTDFSSGYLQIDNVVIPGILTIGDFIAEFGQGLSLWSPYAFSKGSDAVNTVIRKPRSIRPYSSSDEVRFFRGAAYQASVLGISATAFYSAKMLDAAIESDSAGSIYFAGLHRTESEIAKRNSLKSRVAGLMLSGNPLENLTVKGMALNSKFDKVLSSNNLPEQSSDEYTFYSASWKFIFNNFLVSGEVANSGGIYAVTASVIFPLSRKFKIAASYRNYPSDYFHLYGNGFGERSSTRNETGYYLGVKWLFPLGEINAYFDQFKFPGVSSLSDYPSSGTDFLLYLRSTLSRNFKLILKFKNEIKSEDYILADAFKFGETQKQNIRAELLYKIDKSIRGKSRIEIAMAKTADSDASETGYLLYQDIKASLFNRFTISARLTFFETASYNSRVYQFENDLPGQLSNLPLYGKGLKWYFLAKFNPVNQVSLSLKYSEIFKPDELFLSSGNSLILGNLDNRLSFQLDVTL